MLGKFADVRSVAVLGAAFKAGSDDLRGSLTGNLVNRLTLAGYDCRIVEPNLPGYDELDSISGCDAVILMTPHSEFKDFATVRQMGHDRTVYVDMWGFWDEIRYLTDGGVFVENGSLCGAKSLDA